MSIANTTRTHLIYQFIILTVLFLSIGYNELLPDRKFILFLAFIPIFFYQLVIISCCMELMPVPRWMSFLESESKKFNSKIENLKYDSQASLASVSSQTETKEKFSFPDIGEVPIYRRWEKSATNLRPTPKCLDYQQKSKSWMSLNDSKSAERLLSREGSLDVLSPLSERKFSSSIIKKSDKKTSREERAKKAQSWKPSETNFAISEKAELTKSLSVESTEQPLPKCMTDLQEESELSKSYSFPFRQKRFTTWLEKNETNGRESNQSLDLPYWQTVGYNLAVKYEARRRRRVPPNTTNPDLQKEECVHIIHAATKDQEVSTDLYSEKQNSKKCSKLAAARINKLKVGFSNLISKKKDEVSESSSIYSNNKLNKPNLLHKLKTKNISCPQKVKDNPISMPEFPQFLSNDRPLIFYPKYLPFEKDRFESDVKKKMQELAEDQKT